MRVTHDTIAKQASVSRLVVSQVLNKSRHARISASKRQEILNISRQLNYQPRNITTHAIGYVLRVNALSVESEIEVLMEVQSALSSRGYRLTIAEFNTEHPEEFRQTINAKTVDGVIFASWNGGDLTQLISPEVPFVVSAEADGIGAEVEQIVIDFHQSSRLLTKHLLASGHSRIVLVTGPSRVKLHRIVKEGFFDAFQETGTPLSGATLIEVVEASDIGPLLHGQLQGPKPPTAVLGLEFRRVAAVVNQLQSAGYRVPEDISVASVYDSSHYAWIYPPITATTAGGTAIASRIVSRLLEKIENPADDTHEKIVIPSQLIERASVSIPKSN